MAGEQRTSPVELFWDLVFVFAVTQVSTLLSHDLTWPGFGKPMLVLALVWWAWSAFVWAANAHDPEHPAVCGVLLLAMGLAFLVALAVPAGVGRRGDVLRAHVHRRPAPAPRALHGRVTPRQRVVRRDRRVRARHSRSGWVS